MRGRRVRVVQRHRHEELDPVALTNDGATKSRRHEDAQGFVLLCAFEALWQKDMEDIRISSWHELNERLYEGSWEEPLARFRSNLAFRGLGNSAYDLQTGLIRLGGAAERLEGHMLR